MRHVPWITLTAIGIWLLTPLGYDLIHSSFNAGEQLARSIGQVLLLMFTIGFVVMAVVEWTVKFWLRRRRERTIANG